MEWTNKEVAKYLHMFCNEEQDDWAKILPIAEFAYKSHVHSASGISPFELLYGYQPTWSTLAGGQAQMPSVSDCLHCLRKACREASAALQKSKEAMREASEGSHACPTFMPGDKVWVDSDQLGIWTKSAKLADKQVSPFKVPMLEENHSSPVYQLKLPPSYKALHPVFSVNRLSLWKGNKVNGMQPPPPKVVHFEDQAEPEYEIKTILNSKARGKGLSYLVQWKGYDKSHNQWISHMELHQGEFYLKPVRLWHPYIYQNPVYIPKLIILDHRALTSNHGADIMHVSSYTLTWVRCQMLSD
jgi:hypothetical protein